VCVCGVWLCVGVCVVWCVCVCVCPLLLQVLHHLVTLREVWYCETLIKSEIKLCGLYCFK
jgi:hypothetical protein